jgi:hypothetical protein
MDAAKSTLYREVNVTTHSMLEQFDSDEPGQFLCECQDVGCSRRLALRRSEYDAVHRSGGYLVSLDCIADSEVLHRGERHAAVAFRSGARAEGRTLSPSESSRSASSPPESSAAARSRPAPSRWASSPPELSLPELSPPAPSRRAALRLVATAGPPQSSSARSALSLPSSRPWHRQSQSARVLAQLIRERPASPPLRPAS